MADKEQRLQDAQRLANQCMAKRTDAEAELRIQVQFAEQWKSQHRNLMESSGADAERWAVRQQQLLQDIAARDIQVREYQARQMEMQQELDDAITALGATETEVHRARRSARAEESLAAGQASAEGVHSLQLESVQQRLETAQTQLKHTELALETARQDAKDARLESSVLRAQVDAEKAELAVLQGELRASRAAAADSQAVRSELQSAQSEIAELRGKLRATEDMQSLRTQVLKLTEQVDRERVRADAAEAQLAGALDAAAEAAGLREEVPKLRELLGVAADLTGVTVADVERLLARYQATELDLSQQAAALKGELESARRRVEALQAEQAVPAAPEVGALAADPVQVLMTQVQELKRRGAQGGPAAELVAGASHALDTAAAQVKTTVVELQAGNLKLQQRATVAEQQLKACLERMSELQKQRQQQQQKHKQQSTAKPTSKVLHMKLNPSECARSELLEHELKTVQAENEQLRAQLLQSVDPGGVAADDEDGAPGGAAAVPLARLRAENRILKQTKADLQRRQDKLARFFTESSRAFRTAVQDLLGWSVVQKRAVGEKAATYYLSVASGSSEDGTRVLKVSSDGGMQLDTSADWLQTKELKKLVDVYYRTNNDLPGLLANLLLSSTSR